MTIKFTGTVVDGYEIVGDDFIQVCDSREELEKKLLKYIRDGKEVKAFVKEEIHYKVIEKEQPVKWIRGRTLTHDGEWYCSNCDYELYGTYDEESLPKFCPCCGKSMNVDKSV